MVQRITLAELRQRLDYNPETGWFIWKEVKSKKVKPGDRAGYEHHGYRYVTVLDHTYTEHILVWFYQTGKWPRVIVDHKNLNRSDNRWSNLRLSDDSSNQHNTTVRLNNKVGFLGVRQHGKQFRARITIRGNRTWLGDFATPEAAAKAYEEARATVFGPRTYSEQDLKQAVERRIARLRRKPGYRPKLKLTYLERFHESYKKAAPDQCWLWTGRLWDDGSYGVFKAKELGKRAMAASRASWVIHNGPITQPKMVVRHTCDSPMCVNPAHLKIGTYKQNSADCVERGRINRGEDRPAAKLTEANVAQMRRRRQDGDSYRLIANAFGVTLNCAVLAITGVTWKHVTEPVPTRQFSPGRHKAHFGETK